MRGRFSIALALVALAACNEEEAALPQPVTMTADALGFYCQMAMSEHEGPKAQVHLADAATPLFFAQVRDAIAFQRMPEQAAPIRAIYVSDMGRAESWQSPGADNWVLLDQAYLVLGSDAVGGMGAAEIVPFARPEEAARFAAAHGGQVVRLGEIPDEAVLSAAPRLAGNEGEDDFLRRLHAVRESGEQ
ncbi:MAG: nitrous oxide reductase accessory protein NosL [Roseovarius sp.]